MSQSPPRLECLVTRGSGRLRGLMDPGFYLASLNFKPGPVQTVWGVIFSKRWPQIYKQTRYFPPTHTHPLEATEIRHWFLTSPHKTLQAPFLTLCGSAHAGVSSSPAWVGGASDSWDHPYVGQPACAPWIRAGRKIPPVLFPFRFVSGIVGCLGCLLFAVGICRCSCVAYAGVFVSLWRSALLLCLRWGSRAGLQEESKIQI